MKRKEKDLLGERSVGNEFLYGIQTLRAVENFDLSGIKLGKYGEIVDAFTIVKQAAALANRDTGMLTDEISNAICFACEEIRQGHCYEHFPVDMMQGGAGTSTNMNVNEVIANIALENMGSKRGDYERCHPNNHVNMSQSTNDAYPTAIKIALIFAKNPLIEELKGLIEAFQSKAEEFKNVLKIGRTQLQDAVPMTLGQTFSAYATTLSEEIDRIEKNAELFLEVNMGGTAIGTGINSSLRYREKVIQHLASISGLPIVGATDLVEATQDTGSFIMFSSAIKRIAIKLSKICNDLRLLSSGPRAGFNEINLPPAQPGSSIMPGKVNPVIPEAVNQIAFKVIGNDLTVNMAAEAGQLELNAFEPVIVFSLFDSIHLLTKGIKMLRQKCIRGITANSEHCLDTFRNSIGLVTALCPTLGYDQCSSLAKEAQRSNESIYELVLKYDLMPQVELDKILEPANLTQQQS
ncbi:aspartate ammonia-lyase [Ekhidna sp.]